MKPPDFFFAIDQHPDPHLDRNVEDFLKIVRAHPHRKPVGTVQIRDLCGATKHPHGVYVLFSPNGGVRAEVRYVGKTTSRSFIERIPAHFDPREKAWFNTVAKRTLKADTAQGYEAALEASLSLKIVMIGVADVEVAKALETQLRTHLKPTLNTRKAQIYDKPKTTRLRDLAA